MQNFYPRLAPHLVTLIEFFLLACTAVLIFSSSKSSAQPATFRSLERIFDQVARRKRLSVLLVGLSVIAIRVALIPILGVPEPGAHDEFSYLLAADTFAHGRLTNPSHPMWIHFESFHIVQKPTYMSMYPPAQGLVLAGGQLLGRPWIGQVLVTAFMCSTMCWMLQAWFPPSWALLGAVLALLRLGILSYWMNTYWCASVAALGGALVLGAWPRLRKHLRVRQALLLALGLAILANSRPYEGLVFAIPVAVAMLSWLINPLYKDRLGFRFSLTRVILPIFFVLFVAAIATGYYNHAVTGNAFRMPYQVNRDTYAAAPYFIWQTPRLEPMYHHAVMREFYERELVDYRRNRTLTGYLERCVEKFLPSWQFYLGPLFTLPLLALPAVIRQRKMRLPLLICAATIAGFAVQTWTLPHYFAPATGALYILIVQGLRYLRHWAPNHRPLGSAQVRLIPVLACAMILLRVVAVPLHARIEPAWPRGNLQRARLLRQMQEQPSRQLVIVRYGPHHDVHAEWVYNDADIDHAKVVWARDMGMDDNQELLQYFRDRKVWLLEADTPAPQLRNYAN